MPDNAKTFMIEGAQIIYRNFSGEPTQFKPQGGVRTFSVVLDKKFADELAQDGWLVKCKPAREEGEEEFCFIEVTLGYKAYPPKVVAITDSGSTVLGQEQVGILDWADIRNVDIFVRAYEWDVAGKTGTKAYLKSMFVTIEEDPLERKYAMMEQGGE